MKAFVFEAVGTRWVIEIADVLSEVDYQALDNHIHELIEEFDKGFSRFRQDSLVTQIAHRAGEYILPEGGAEMLELYEQLYRLTDGRFTPLIGSVLVDAGYDAHYSLTPKKLHHPKHWEDVMAVSGQKLLIKEPALLDFGALGKGKLIDLIAEFLGQRVRSFLIDAGGDIRHQGTSVLRVGLEHPENPQQVIGVAKIRKQNIAASAGNRRRWGKYHHIIDPQTLASPERILATWAVADTAMLADGLATALFLGEPERFQERFSFSYLRLFADYAVDKSEDFPAELYYT